MTDEPEASDMPESSIPTAELMRRREATVAEHMSAEMAGDLDRTLATFGDVPEYDIVPLHGLRRGDAEVRDLLGHLTTAFPDLTLEVVVLRHALDAVIIEGLMRGTHRGSYAGHPPHGGSMLLRAAVFFHFDNDRLLRETVYYDELTLLSQIGALPAAFVIREDA